MELKYDAKGRYLVLADLPTDKTAYEIHRQCRTLGGFFSKPHNGWLFTFKRYTLTKLVVQFSPHVDGTVTEAVSKQDKIDQIVWMEKKRLIGPAIPCYEASMMWHLHKYPVKTDPYFHQRVGTSFLIDSDGCMLLDDMGLGKTKEAIDAANACRTNGSYKYPFVVWVCPNGVRQSIKQQIEQHSSEEGGTVVVLSGSTASRITKINELLCYRDITKPTWVIVNYESLRLLGEHFLNLAYDSILVCDEAHRLKSWNAQVTKMVRRAKPDKLWLLTGTPIANRPEDLFSLINLVRPGLCGWRWHTFEAQHITRNQFGGIQSYKNLDILRDALASVSLGRKKEQCLDLPPKIFIKMPVELSAKERKAYDEMVKDLEAEIEESGDKIAAENYAVRFSKLRQITSGFLIDTKKGLYDYNTPTIGTTKADAAVELWESSGNKKMIVWVHFKATSAILESAFTEAGAWVRVVNGYTSSVLRQAYIDLWKGSEGGVLIGQMDCMGEGVNLQTGDLQVFVDRPLTPKQRKQCVDRLHRIGQNKPVTIVDIIANRTIDAKIFNALEKKIEMANEVEFASFTTADVLDADDKV